ncbi:MAG: Rpn family recombination-promoting nuclease/putative transposase [Thiohalospira sp.]
MAHDPHDHSYKLLFSHPEMVADLLRGYVREPWVEQLDFATLTRVNDGYVSDDLREREDDIVWRIRWRGDGDQWLYVYLLLEFQSRPDRFMALRVMTYLGLLYEDLRKGNQLTPSGKLPPVLPVVLYNGRHRWHAPVDVAELVESIPGGLERYRPSLRYLLLDEGCFADQPLAARNVVSALFTLENSRAPADIQRVLDALLTWLTQPEQKSLRRSFTVWLKRVLLPARMPGVNFEQVHELQEVRSMLEERVKEWTLDWKQQGIQEGIREGIEQGIEQGRQEGEATLLLRLIERKFGAEAAAANQVRIEQADAETLLLWSERILAAEQVEELFD